MIRTPVVSSCVKSVGYEPETKTLEIEFYKTGVYSYFEIPVTFYEALISAPSIGAFVNYNIKQGNLIYSKGPALEEDVEGNGI